MTDEKIDSPRLLPPNVRQLIYDHTVAFFAPNRLLGNPYHPNDVVRSWSELHARRRSDNIVGRFKRFLSIDLRPSQDARLYDDFAVIVITKC